MAGKIKFIGKRQSLTVGQAYSSWSSGLGSIADDLRVACGLAEFARSSSCVTPHKSSARPFMKSQHFGLTERALFAEHIVVLLMMRLVVGQGC